MKQILILVILAGLTGNLFAVKVKFSVDMSGQDISTNGVHVTGDFQDEAGLPNGDWQSNTATCVKEGSSSVYSIVVDIPALRKYEYKFVNGDQFYEAEFVPGPSRVSYDFNDNRWIYVDSTAGTDTFFVSPILFASNAPAGKKLFRVAVDSREMPVVNPEGLFVAMNFNDYIPVKMDNLFETYYDKIFYVDSAQDIQYKFVNGSNQTNSETVPAGCSNGTNRTSTVTSDNYIPAVCFGSCAACASTGLEALLSVGNTIVYPNPSIDKINVLVYENTQVKALEVFSSDGRLVYSDPEPGKSNYEIRREVTGSGMFYLKLTGRQGENRSMTIIFR